MLKRCSHDCYHLPGWMRAAEFGDGGKACAVYATDGENELLVPIIRREVDAGGWDAVSPYGYGGPAVSDAVSQDFLDQAMAAIVNRLREAGCISWFIRLHPLLNVDWHSAVGELVEQGRTVSIDLAKTAEEHWQETCSSHRRNIRKSLEAGVTARIDQDFEAMPTFIKLYRQSMERLDAADYYHFDDRYYEALTGGLGASLKLFVAEEGGAIIAAALVTVARAAGIIQAHLYGMDERYAHRQPQKIITHAVRAWGRESGLKRFHLGGGVGGSSSDSLFHFKKGFSPDTHAFRTHRVIVHPEKYLTLCGGDRSVLSDMTRYFPAYRREAATVDAGGGSEALANG
ncbi:hypothetical protein GCM10027081_38290 [Cupriavidus yeoncheonensis]